MSCCGNKRQAWIANNWSNSDEPQAAPMNIETDIESHKPFWFEWIGSGSFRAIGLATQTAYNWYFSGQKQEVAYEDSYALMAENNLRICTPD